MNSISLQQYPGITALTDHIENLLESADFSLYWKDKAGKYISANKYFLELNEMKKPEDLVGKNDFDLGWPCQAPILHINDQQVVHTEMTRTYIEPVQVGLDVCWFLSHKQPLYSKTGKITGVFGQSILIKDNQFENDSLNDNPINKPKCDLGQKVLNLELTQRQSQCLYYLILGMTAKQIGKIINLSPRTVEFYINQLKEKFSCRNRSELIRKAVEMDFIRNLLIN